MEVQTLQSFREQHWGLMLMNSRIRSILEVVVWKKALYQKYQ